MTHPDTLDRRTAAVLRRSRLGIWLTTAGTATLVATLLTGLTLLASRSLLGIDPLSALESRLATTTPWLWPWALLAPILPILAWATLRTRRRAMTPAAAALWLDVHAGATGELVTQREVGASAAPWRSAAEARALTTDDLPHPPWGQASFRAVLGAAFLVATLFTPIRSASATPRFEALFDDRLESVDEQLTALKEEVALEEEDLAELEETLERLEADARENPDLEATYEAIDRLEERLAERAEEAREAAETAAENLSRAEESLAQADAASGMQTPTEALDALAEALDAAEGLELNELDLAEVGAAFADMLEANRESGATNLDLSKLAELAREGGLEGLDAAALAELSEALMEAMEGSLSDLVAAGLLDAKALKSLDQLPSLSAEQLAKLEACPDCERLSPSEPGEP